MAPPGRRPDPSLSWRLFNEGARFEFFQAVRLLGRMFPERRQVGGEPSGTREVVRFRSNPILAFPPSDVGAVDHDDADGRVEMSVNFMGLVGPHATLPRHYTVLVAERIRRKDFALRDFLDLFTHRLVSLFYRAWERFRFPVGFERSVEGRERGVSELARDVDVAGLDRFSRHLLDLIGLGTDGLLRPLEVDLRALLFNAGLLVSRCRSASALEGLLRGYFGVGVAVRQFTGQWLPIPPASRTRLGRANSGLGGSGVLGARFWDPQTKFTVQLGPVGYRSFRQFLPSGDAFRPLVQLTRFFAGEELDFDVQIVVEAAEVPECRLGSADTAAQLGWSSWLKTKPFARDADDPLFDGRRILARIGASAIGEAMEKREGDRPDEEANDGRESEVPDR